MTFVKFVLQFVFLLVKVQWGAQISFSLPFKFATISRQKKKAKAVIILSNNLDLLRS